MKNFLFIRTLCLAFLLPFFVHGQATDMPLLSATGARSYGNLPVGQLNLAYRQQLAGQFEIALLTYNSALAWQPNWVPALAGRSALLARLGRSAEAKRDRELASRQNPTATAFFLAKGRNGLMPFLALYPHDWYEKNYGFAAKDQATDEALTPQTYFYEQYAKISNASDTMLAVRALQQKVDQDILASRRSLDSLPADYNQGVKKMLLANLAMLNHEYTRGINLYTDAFLKNGVDWSELHYNRGLGYILVNNYMNGCEDLTEAANKGFQPAIVMLDGLCNF